MASLLSRLKSRYTLTKNVDAIIAEARDPSKSLKKTLGAMDLVALGIGAIIGTGIFVLAGRGATIAGPGIVLSFIVAGITCALAGLCYAELASTIPNSGSAYGYTYSTLGEPIAWTLAWALVLEYAVGSLTVSIGWSGYAQGLLANAGYHLPLSIGQSFLDGPGGGINLPAALIAGIVTLVLVRGAKESARATVVLVGIKLVIIVLVIAAGFFYFNPTNITANPLPFGVSGVFAGAAVIFFAYIGFDAVSTTAEETKNPKRDLPIGILGSLAICTVLYLLASTVLVGMVNYSQFVPGNEAYRAPFEFAFRNAGARVLAAIIAAGAIAGITSVLLVLLLGGPRVFFALARDGLLPQSLAKVHPKYGTPYKTTLITGAFVAIGAGFMPLAWAANLTNAGTLYAFALVCVGTLVLRRTRPDIERPFRVPAAWLIAPLGAFACIYLIYKLDTTTILAFFTWMGLGLIVYALYGMRNSRRHNEVLAQRSGAPVTDMGAARSVEVQPRK